MVFLHYTPSKFVIVPRLMPNSCIINKSLRPLPLSPPSTIIQVEPDTVGDLAESHHTKRDSLVLLCLYHISRSIVHVAKTNIRHDVR